MSHLSFRRFAVNAGAILTISAVIAGMAYAAAPRNSVTSTSIKNNTIISADVKDGSLQGRDLKRDTLGLREIKEAKLTNVASVRTQALVGRKLAIAGIGTDQVTARAAATPVTLYSEPPFTVYAKCFRSTAPDRMYGEVYISSTTNGGVFDSTGGGTLNTNGSLLDATTPETARVIVSSNAAVGALNSSLNHYYEALAINGTYVSGLFSVTVKHGVFAAGNGAFGANDVCLFHGVDNLATA